MKRLKNAAAEHFRTLTGRMPKQQYRSTEDRTLKSIHKNIKQVVTVMFPQSEKNDQILYGSDLRFLAAAVFFPTADDVRSFDEAPVAV